MCTSPHGGCVRRFFAIFFKKYPCGELVRRAARRYTEAILQVFCPAPAPISPVGAGAPFFKNEKAPEKACQKLDKMIK